MTADWPVAQIDEVQRMRVLAASLPGASYAEEFLDTPFEQVWDYIGDMERSMPALVSVFRDFRIIEREGEHLTARATGRLGARGTFQIVLRPGWCLMQDRFAVGGFAAVGFEQGTRVAACAGPRVPGSRVLGPLYGRQAARRSLSRLLSHLA